MSLATLKKKSEVIQSRHSIGKNGFSLNGCLRPQGYIGQTSLSRTLPRSLAGSNGVLRGHGGAGISKNVDSTGGIVSGLYDYNDNTVVKPSVQNTRSLIRTKYMGLLNRGNEKPACMLDPSSPNYCGRVVDETSGAHTRALTAKALQCNHKCDKVEEGGDPAPAPPETITDPFILQIMRPKYTNYNAIRNSCPTSKPAENKNVYFNSYAEYSNFHHSSQNLSKVVVASETYKVPVPSITIPKKDIYV